MNVKFWLYTNDKKEQHSFVQTATDKGYEVLELGGPLVSHLISRLESTNTDVQFSRVDADIIDKLIEKEESSVSKLSDKEQEKLKKMKSYSMDIYRGETNENEWKNLLSDASKPIINRTISGLYPPGSSFKLITAFNLIENGLLDPEDNLMCDGAYTV